MDNKLAKIHEYFDNHVFDRDATANDLRGLVRSNKKHNHDTRNWINMVKGMGHKFKVCKCGYLTYE